MKMSYYVLPPNAGFKFGTPAERDQFWASLKDAVRVGAEKIGNRTIRLHPAKMKQGFEWHMATVNGATTQAVVSPQPAPTALTGTVSPDAPKPATLKDTLTTTNPFEKLASNPTRPLPGLCPPPPPEMLAANQPPEPISPPQDSTSPLATEGSAVAEAPAVAEASSPTIEELNTATEIPKEQELAAALDAVVNPDPEPNCDKRKKEWRDWKARQA